MEYVGDTVIVPNGLVVGVYRNDVGNTVFEIVTDCVRLF
jgi:hypothetical protein